MPDTSRNLTLDRGGPNVWDRQSWMSPAAGDRDRWVALAGGATMAGLGIRRRGLTGTALTIAGLGLMVRALRGRHDLRLARHWVEGRMRDRGWRAADVVATASDESFPASDAPSWTPMAGTSTRNSATRG